MTASLYLILMIVLVDEVVVRECMHMPEEFANENPCKSERQNVTCACGKLDFIDITFQMCNVKDPITKTISCRPCNEDLFNGHICDRYMNCEKCYPAGCLTCPPNKYGDFCNDESKEHWKDLNTMEIFPTVSSKVIIAKKKPIMSDYYLSQYSDCGFPKNLNTAELICSFTTNEVQCIQNCIWGHTSDRQKSVLHRCVKKLNKWIPLKIEECTKVADCDIELISNGTLVCNIMKKNKPDTCKVSCFANENNEGTVESDYVCDLHGNYYPPLPYCVKKNSAIAKDEKILDKELQKEKAFEIEFQKEKAFEVEFQKEKVFEEAGKEEMNKKEIAKKTAIKGKKY